MAGKTIAIGVVLIVLGLAGYLGTGATHVTALIPSFFGVPLLILGVLARDDRKRKVVMHIAVLIGLIGFAGSLYSLVTRARVGSPAAIASQALMTLLMGIFVGLCVKSFIDARRNT